MRNWPIIIISVALLIILPATSWSMQNTNIYNPAGASRAPRSSTSSSLIRSPNPMGTNGNLIVTGNVGGGRYFRGSVPYRSGTSFQDTLGSTSLDSFMRDSANSESTGYYSGNYRPQPYYSPTGTVTTTRVGQSGVFNPATSSASARASGTSGLRATAGAGAYMSLQEKISSGQYTQIPADNIRPLRISPAELEKLISEGVAVAGRARRLVDEEDVAQMERLRRDLQQLRLKTSDLRQSLVVRDDSQRPFNKLLKEQDQQDQRAVRPKVSKKATRREPIDLNEQLRQQLVSLQEALAQKTTDKERQEILKEFYLEKLRKAKAAEQQSQRSRGLTREEMTALEKLKQLSEQPEAKKDVPGPDLSVSARRILSEYKNFESFADDKFTQHVSNAEAYLKQGRYYQAVDAYTLATIYNPDGAPAYTGKSQALFAAGEYMSSALFLSRALDISPEQAKAKVDFVAIFGDKEKLNKRIADVEEWLQRSNAAELEFLVGYVYYHTGELDSARKAIDAAYKKQPESPAVGAVKDAIYDAMGLKGK